MYTSYTLDLNMRFLAHKTGRGYYTRKYQFYEYLYCEKVNTRAQARKKAEFIDSQDDLWKDELIRNSDVKAFLKQEKEREESNKESTQRSIRIKKNTFSLIKAIAEKRDTSINQVIKSLLYIALSRSGLIQSKTNNRLLFSIVKSKIINYLLLEHLIVTVVSLPNT